MDERDKFIADLKRQAQSTVDEIKILEHDRQRVIHELYRTADYIKKLNAFIVEYGTQFGIEPIPFGEET